MKKLFVESVGMVFMILFIPVYAWGDNAVFNPGFDMSPWDSGWTIEIDTSYGRYSSAEAEVKTDSGRSLPNGCYLKTYVRFCGESPGGNSGEADAKAIITQNFDGIANCMVKTYVKYYLCRQSSCCICWSQCSLQVCVNNNWETIWQKFIDEGFSPVFDTVWADICTTFVNDTISGIRFCASSYIYTGCARGPWDTYSHFYVDDVYVGEMGVEESEELRVKSLELRVYPNPFTQYTAIKLFNHPRQIGISALPQQAIRKKVKVYDMMGRLVEETESGVIGKDLRAGVYFVKVRGCKPLKIIKLMEVL
ncbi:T9SS type A sorting domain-containing protein [candidate division WOR-3 bacterium]|nr:T9SS type A sorting domain-containing protein [candidate division WOR-3 bacterium]